MKTLLTLCLVCTIICSQAQITFQKTYGGLNDDYAYSVKQTSDGGYIMAGSTESFGTGGRIYLIKTNSFGDTLWTKTIGGDYEVGESIQQTSDGGYILSGMASDSLFNSIVYLIKTDSNGTVLWRKCYEGGEGSSVFQNTDHGYIICGTVSGGFNTTDLSLIRTDSSGNPLWIKRVNLFNLGGSDYAYSVQQTNDGGFVVAGLVGPTVYYAFLLKFSGNGALTWHKVFNSSATNYLGQSVQQTNDGGYMIAGYAGNAPLLIKTNALGNPVWSKTYSSASFSYATAYSMQQTTDDGYIVACFNYNWSTSKIYPFLFKTDSIGTVLWAKQYSFCNSNIPNYSYPSVRQTLDGGYILSCSTDSFGAGAKDFCLIKTNSTGGTGCFDSTLIISASTIVTMTTPVSPSVYIETAALVPNASIGSGGIVTTICSNATSVIDMKIDIKLLTILPNPILNTGTISFLLSRSQKVSLKIFNVSGQLVSTLADHVFHAGNNELVWNTNEMTAGVYFLQFQSEEIQQTMKLI